MNLKESKARKELCFELRKKTGLGLMSAKECLIDNDWDIVKAEENHMKYKLTKIINTMSVYTEEDRKLEEAKDKLSPREVESMEKYIQMYIKRSQENKEKISDNDAVLKEAFDLLNQCKSRIKEIQDIITEKTKGKKPVSLADLQILSIREGARQAFLQIIAYLEYLNYKN